LYIENVALPFHSFPYWHQLGYSSPQAAEHADIDMTEFCLHQLELLLVQQTAPQDTAAIIIETVIGEGIYVLRLVE